MTPTTYEFQPTSFVLDILNEFCSGQDSVEMRHAPMALNALRNRLKLRSLRKDKRVSPLERMQHCRKALDRLDNAGWKRSYHQRLFHDDFLKACTRSFWKTEPVGSFARDHGKVLEINSWEHLAAEVLISTPRRFGKTISVSMFAAGMLYSAPSIELSIYSTCKRISQKLLRNVNKFFDIIVNHDMTLEGFKVIRQNMEEIVLQGPCGVTDVRVVNSYPSKVSYPCQCVFV
tara:strand:+ start:10684 stop:11376 length:693 start_codon:yes stop_codon:yes gene_type:complete